MVREGRPDEPGAKLPPPCGPERRRGLWDPLQHSQGLAGRSRDRAGSTRMAITAMKAGPQVPG